MTDTTTLRVLAEKLGWARPVAREDDPWGYVTDAEPGSVYAAYIAACSPDRILALLDVVDAARSHLHFFVNRPACLECSALARLDEVLGGTP
jgi:hypothetical protein